jgi:hypothetical protein
MKGKIAMVAMMATAIVVTSAMGQNASKQSANEKTFLGGAGATKCSKWLIQRHSAPGHDPVFEFGLLSWVSGFVSGANLVDTTTVGGSSEFLFGFADEDVFARVDFYCREHPSDILYRAAAFVTADLLDTFAAQLLKKAR